MTEEIKAARWRSPTLNKGWHMSTTHSGRMCTVEHVDRVVDPYLAGCWEMKGDTTELIYTGLHPTLAEARQFAIRSAETGK